MPVLRSTDFRFKLIINMMDRLTRDGRVMPVHFPAYGMDHKGSIPVRDISHGFQHLFPVGCGGPSSYQVATEGSFPSGNWTGARSCLRGIPVPMLRLRGAVPQLSCTFSTHGEFLGSVAMRFANG